MDIFYLPSWPTSTWHQHLVIGYVKTFSPCTYCTYLYIYTKYTTYIHNQRSTINTKDTSKDPELFGIEHGNDAAADADAFANDELEEDEQQQQQEQQQLATPQKRHIGAVYRSGFLPSYRYLRSPTGSTGGRFSRSGRARQFVWVNGDGSMCAA